MLQEFSERKILPVFFNVQKSFAIEKRQIPNSFRAGCSVEFVPKFLER